MTVVSPKAERAEAHTLQRSHWATSRLKRCLFGTYGSAISMKCLQAHLGEYVFRYNRPGTKGVGCITARPIAQLAPDGPRTMHQIVDETVPYAGFRIRRPN